MRKLLTICLLPLLLAGCSVTFGVGVRPMPGPGYQRPPIHYPVYRPVYHPHCGCYR